MFDMIGKLIRPRAYYDNPGTKLVPSFSDINNTLSGISSGISATVLNLLSGLSAQASQLNYATSFPASAAYAVSAGTAASVASASYAVSAGALSGLTISANVLNTVLYGTALFKYAIGSTVASNGMILSHGLSNGLYGFVNPHSSGLICGGLVSATGIQFSIFEDTGLLLQETSAAVDFIIIGN